MSLLPPQEFSAASIARLFETVRFRFGSEVDLQNGVELVLQRSKIAFAREKALNAKDRPDFLVESGVAIEIKIQGTFAQAVRQIDRYSKHESVLSILVIGSPVWISRIPLVIGGKPVHAIRITESLL